MAKKVAWMQMKAMQQATKPAASAAMQIPVPVAVPTPVPHNVFVPQMPQMPPNSMQQQAMMQPTMHPHVPQMGQHPMQFQPPQAGMMGPAMGPGMSGPPSSAGSGSESLSVPACFSKKQRKRMLAAAAAAVGQDSSEDSSEEGVQLKPATKEDKKRMKMAKELEASKRVQQETMNEVERLKAVNAVAEGKSQEYRTMLDKAQDVKAMLVTLQGQRPGGSVGDASKEDRPAPGGGSLPGKGPGGPGPTAPTEPEVGADTGGKVDFDGYRQLWVAKLSTKGDDFCDELREAENKADLHKILKKIGREQLMMTCLEIGAVMTEYEKSRLTRDALLAKAAEARLE